MSDVYALRARLAEEQARNSELRGMLWELGSGVSQAYREMENYKNQVRQSLTDSHNRIRSSHENIIHAHELQAQIDILYTRFKNMELANKRIREANNKKYYEFADYTTVRKIVQGMLDNMNFGMISDEVVYRSIEKEHLQTPDYWLTTVLLAVMAWKNDDRDRADRALEMSIRLDKKNSSIFYMLFNIRVGREPAALKWFHVYQECELKGEDQKTFLMLFSLLNKTLQEEVDDKVKYEVSDYIQRVIAMNLRAEIYNEESLSDRIEQYLLRMKQEDPAELNMLGRCLSDYAEMADVMACARNNIQILQFILDVGNVSEDVKNEYIERFINEEIAKPNDMELAVYDTIEYNELLISCYGDKERADQIYRQRQEHKKEDLNLVAEMIDWIYDAGGRDRVNSQIRLNMFSLTGWLQKKAVRQYTEHYRSRVKTVHPVSLGDYSASVDFNDRNDEERKIKAFYENQRDQALSRISIVPAIVGAVIAGLGIAGALYLQNYSIAGLGVIGIVIIAVTLFQNSRQRKHLEETCGLNIKNRNEQMDQLFSEFRSWQEQFAEYDAWSSRIAEELDRY